MAVQTVPTKGNLMNTKKSLALAKNGYELLDRKRNILIREMMTLIDHANAIQQKNLMTLMQRLTQHFKRQMLPTAFVKIFLTLFPMRTA